MRLKRLLLALLACALLWAPTGRATSVGGNTPNGRVPNHDCPEPDDECGETPPPEPAGRDGDKYNQQRECPVPDNGCDSPDGGGGESDSENDCGPPPCEAPAPAVDAPQVPNEPDKNPDDRCEDPDGKWNPTDAPDSLPTRGERIRLEMVPGSAGSIFRWGRHIGFGGMARLNFLSKAQVTADLQFVRVCDPRDNSIATFEREGGGNEYRAVDAIGYPDDVRVILDNPADGVPQTLTIAFPSGAAVIMEFETDAPPRRELDGLVYRVVERRTAQGESVRIAYREDRVLLTDASGNEYVCLLDDEDRIVEINFTVDGATRRWFYTYNHHTYAGKDAHITETNAQTGKTIGTWLRGRLVATDIDTATPGAIAQSSRSAFYRPGSWTNRGHTRLLDRTAVGGSGTVVFREETAPDSVVERRFSLLGMTEITHADGSSIRYERNRQKLWTKKIDELGHVREREYDGNRRLLRATFPDGGRSEYEYDARGNRVLRRRLLGDGDWAVDRYEYDDANRLVRWLDAGGGETRYLRDGDGNIVHKLVRAGDASWHAVAYDYNRRGQMTAVSLPYEVDDPSRAALARPADNALVVAYDAWGNQTSRTDALGNTRRFEYDAGNKLIAKTDALGNRTDYEYDGLGQLVRQTNPNGHGVAWTYNAQGRVAEIRSESPSGGCGSCGTAVAAGGRPGVYDWSDDGLLRSHTDPEGRVTRYAYDKRRRRVSETDPAGNETRHEYDAAGRRVRTVLPDGAARLTAYDAAGRVLSRTDALGNATVNEYDLAGRLVRVRRPDGGETVTVRDARGNPVAVRTRVDDATWRETRMTYDLRGVLVERTDAYGTPDAVTTRFAHDAAGRLVAVIVDPDGLALATRSVHDDAGRLVQSIDANGNATRFVYDEIGNLVETLSPEGRKTAFEYDVAGRLITTTLDPDGVAQFQSTVYDAGGRVLEVADALTSVAYQYNLAGQPIRIATPGGSASELRYDHAGRLVETRRQSDDGTIVIASRREYDDAGRVSRAIDEAGAETLYRYDAEGRVVAVTDPLGAVTSFEYDAVGRQTRVVPPHGGERRYVYNLAGELVRGEGGPEGTRRYAYDQLGRQTAVTDANDRTKRLFLDKAGRIVRMENEMAQGVEYAYDANGNRLTLTDANGNTSVFAYDRDNNLIGLRYPDVPGEPESVERYEYDGAGRLIRKTTPNGDDIRWLHDRAGNVLAMYHGQECASADDIPGDRLIARYQYDGAGRVLVEEDPNTAMLHAYDSFGRLVEARDRTLAKAVRYQYDPRGLRSAMRVVDYDQDPEGRALMTVTYAYDQAGRLASVKKDDDQPTVYEYDTAGRRTKLTLPNGVHTAYTYDMADRLRDITTRKSDGTVIAAFAYDVDPTGNRTGIVYADGSRSVYLFDDAYRLTQDKRIAADGGLLYDETYTYDAVGNRMTKLRTGWSPVNVGYSYNARNQLIETSGSESRRWVYDHSGNPVLIHSSTDDEVMTYDTLGRLIQREWGSWSKSILYRSGEWQKWKVSIAGNDTAFL